MRKNYAIGLELIFERLDELKEYLGEVVRIEDIIKDFKEYFDYE